MVYIGRYIQGQYAPNEILKGVTKLFEGRLQGAGT